MACITGKLPEIGGAKCEVADWTFIQPNAPLIDWEIIGVATFEVYKDEAGVQCLRGFGDNRQNSFLVSKKHYADFELQLEVKIQPGGNSGVQIRSHINERGRVEGYQIEIDPSERSWSGGLFDEARRAWLDSLEDNPAGRAAFKVGEWNTYRISCIGDHIQAWVNGVACADFHDSADSSGFIAFQVHGGGKTQVEFRKIRVKTE